MQFDPERVRANVSRSTTQDLLDRMTVYREGMEPEALDIIEAELRRRGVTTQELLEHERDHERRNQLATEGVPRRCSFCDRPAVASGWGWHRLWGLLPLFPRRFFYCAVDWARRRPGAGASAEEGERTTPAEGASGPPRG